MSEALRCQIGNRFSLSCPFETRRPIYRFGCFRVFKCENTVERANVRIWELVDLLLDLKYLPTQLGFPSFLSFPF